MSQAERSALARKLGIKGGQRVATFNAPEHLSDLLHPLPDNVDLAAHPEGAGPFDVILVFARERLRLDAELPEVRERLAWSGGLWVAWPKKSSSLETDLDKLAVQEMGLAAGLVDNKVCAVDDDWSALRFVYRLEDRPG